MGLRRAFPVVLAVLVTAGWTGFLTFISTQPRPSAPTEPLPYGISWAFVAHFGGYGVLAFLLTLSLQVMSGNSATRLWVSVACGIAAAAYGGVMEVGQLWVPGRFASVQDGLINTLGAAVGALLAWWLIVATRRVLARRIPTN